MAWLGGWDKRIKITLPDYAGDIGASVTWFPVVVYLTSTQCEEVFVELTTDAEYLKMQFTKADGITPLYGEKELYDVSAQKGIFHVSRDGWTIDANTSIYLYYDKDHADNTTYIGAIDTTPGYAVWDGNFKFVSHMVDATTSTVKDSTSNGNDGTKGSANNPIESTGKIGKGQDFSSDQITMADSASLDIDTNITIEACINLDTYGEFIDPNRHGRIVAKNNNGNYDFYTQEISSVNTLGYKTSSGAGAVSDAGHLSLSTWQHVAVTYDETTVAFYIDSVARGGGATAGGLTPDNDSVYIGTLGDLSRHFDGDMDEVRISGSIRSAAWVKATYNSLYDTLLTYGSEEKGFIPQVIIF